MTETSGSAATESVPQALQKDFMTYVDTLKRNWLGENRVNSKDVYEVMRPEERNRVHGRIRGWEIYITPLAEAWWKERGYGVIWPDDNLQPMQVQRLESA